MVAGSSPVFSMPIKSKEKLNFMLSLLCQRVIAICQDSEIGIRTQEDLINMTETYVGSNPTLGTNRSITLGELFRAFAGSIPAMW